MPVSRSDSIFPYEYAVFDITNCNSLVTFKKRDSKRSPSFGNSLYDVMSSHDISYLLAYLKSYKNEPVFVPTSRGIALALPNLVPASGLLILLFPSFGGDRLLRIYRHMKWNAHFAHGVAEHSSRMTSACSVFIPQATEIKQIIDQAFGGLSDIGVKVPVGDDISTDLISRIQAISRFIDVPIDVGCRDSVNANVFFDLPIFVSASFIMASVSYSHSASIRICLAMNDYEIEETVEFSAATDVIDKDPAIVYLRQMLRRRRMDLLLFADKNRTHYKIYPTAKDWSVLGIKQPDHRKGEKMSKIYQSASELIGNTPLLRLNNIEKELGLQATLIVKPEFLNPAGSVKDRAALAMINAAERDGALTEGSVIIEPTSGNTGIGLCSVARARGYRVIIVMPDTMSEERRKIMKAYGAELVLTDGALGMKGAIEKAEELSRDIPLAFIPDQFNNPENARAHFDTTGPEIWNDTDGQVDIFVAGVGTGGTITGVGEYLKSKKPDVKIVAVEPAESPLLSEGRSGPHKIQGIGANFVPSVLNTAIYDEIIPVKGESAMEMARMTGSREGILVGISSGAAISAAIDLAKRPENKGKCIVALLPDTGDRYLSTELFSN